MNEVILLFWNSLPFYYTLGEIFYMSAPRHKKVEKKPRAYKSFTDKEKKHKREMSVNKQKFIHECRV